MRGEKGTIHEAKGQGKLGLPKCCDYKVRGERGNATVVKTTGHSDQAIMGGKALGRLRPGVCRNPGMKRETRRKGEAVPRR